MTEVYRDYMDLIVGKVMGYGDGRGRWILERRGGKKFEQIDFLCSLIIDNTTFP